MQIFCAAARASGLGPRGFSFALIMTASSGMLSILDSCASAGSPKNGRVEPAAIKPAILPRLRRENPRSRRSDFCLGLSVMIGLLSAVQTHVGIQIGKTDLRTGENGGASGRRLADSDS